MAADTDVTVRYVLKDDLTPGLKRMEGQAEATDRKLKSMGSGNGTLLRMFDALDGKLGNVDAQFRSLDKSLMSASKTMQHDMLIGIRNVTLGLTAAAGAATFFGLKAVNSFQHTQAAFSVLTGSMAQGQALYNSLLQLNLKSPFDQQPLAQSAQTLLGFRIPQQQLMPLLTNISNVAAVQQDPNEALMRMSLAVGQISQSGIVRAQDLNQLVQAGFPAYRLIPGGHAALVGGSSGGTRMSSDTFINALTNPNNPVLAPYAGASAAMNQTLSGQWSNLTTMLRQEAIRDFSGMGNELVKQMPDLTKVLSGEMRDLAPAISRVGADIIKGAEDILPVLEPIVKAMLSGIDELARAGGPFLRELRQQDPAITAALGDFFTTLATVEPDLTALFIDMVQLLPPFVRALDDLILLVDPVLKMVDGLMGLGPVRTIVGDLLVGLLMYRTLAPAVKATLAMRDALFGLAAAETAAAAAGEAGAAGGVGRGAGLLGVGGKNAGRAGKAVGVLGGLSLLLPGAAAGWGGGGRGWGDDLSTVGGAALTGASFAGAPGAAAGAVLASAYDLALHIGGVNGNRGKALTAGYLSRANGWSDAMMNDPKLIALMQRSGASLNLASGAIVVHNAKDPEATAKAIRDELEKWLREHQERG